MFSKHDGGTQSQNCIPIPFYFLLSNIITRLERAIALELEGRTVKSCGVAFRRGGGFNATENFILLHNNFL